MKLRIDIVPANEEEEIIIRTHEKSDKIRLIERALSGSLDSAEMILTLGDTEYYVPKDEILFFETSDNKVAAHTKDRMYYTKYKL